MYCIDRGCAVVLGDMNGQIGPSVGSRCPMPQSHRGLASLVAHPVCKGAVVTYTGYDDQSDTHFDHICLHKSDICNVKKCLVHEDSDINTSDHHAITVTVKTDLQRFLPNVRSVYRWDKGDIMQYKDIIKSLNVSTLVSDSGSNIDEIADEICNVMLQVSNIAIPKSRFYSFCKPYWDDTPKELHTKQKNLRITWMKEGRPRGRHHRSFRLYKEAKALFAKTLKMKEMEYDQKWFENIQNDQELDIRRFWRYVRSHKDSIQVIHNIEKDGIVYSSPEELRKMWKSHFEAILYDNDDGIDGFDERFKDFIDGQIGSLNISMRKDIDSMGIFEEPFTMEEITLLCSNLPNNKALHCRAVENMFIIPCIQGKNETKRPRKFISRHNPNARTEQIIWKSCME